jgi:hypothetical protein
MSTVEESQMADHNTMCINGLRPKEIRVAEKIRAARVFPGDERMRREMGELCHDCDVACPHGCHDGTGAVPYTWWHAAFFCKECDTSVARAGFLAAAQQARGALRGSSKSGSAEHGQLASLRFWIETGMAWQVGTSFGSIAAADLRQARRFMGALPDRVEGRGGKAATTAARRVVMCGAAVIEAAEAASIAFVSNVRERLKARRTMRSVCGGWREVVARGGPARAAELARAGTAMRLLLWARRGATRTAAEIVAEHVASRGAWARMVQQSTRRARTLAPATQWLLRRWVARWHEGVRYEWAADLEGCLARSTQADPAAGLRVDVVAAPYTEMSLVHYVGARAEIAWEAGGFAGRHKFPGSGGVWQRVSSEQVEARAHTLWLVAGGWRAVEREAK